MSAGLKKLRYKVNLKVSIFSQKFPLLLGQKKRKNFLWSGINTFLFGIDCSVIHNRFMLTLGMLSKKPCALKIKFFSVSNLFVFANNFVVKNFRTPKILDTVNVFQKLERCDQYVLTFHVS